MKTKTQKQIEAGERNNAHFNRSNEQQLALIATRPGNSTKERSKLRKATFSNKR